MIAWLHGKIIDKQHPGRLVINVNGVGYDVETSLQTFFQLDNEQANYSLYIQTIVREDAFLLYGFIDKTERALFRALIKVNGIGPKAAMNILSSVTPTEFIQCIMQQNTLLLTKLPGIGKKTAERLVIEMKDTIQNVLQGDSPLSNQTIMSTLHEQDEAIRALEALGYKSQEASKVVKKIDDGTKTCEQLIRQGLQMLAKH